MTGRCRLLRCRGGVLCVFESITGAGGGKEGKHETVDVSNGMGRERCGGGRGRDRLALSLHNGHGDGLPAALHSSLHVYVTSSPLLLLSSLPPPRCFLSTQRREL